MNEEVKTHGKRPSFGWPSSSYRKTHKSRKCGRNGRRRKLRQSRHLQIGVSDFPRSKKQMKWTKGGVVTQGFLTTEH